MSNEKPSTGHTPHTDESILSAITDQAAQELHPLLEALGKHWKSVTACIVVIIAIVAGRSVYLNHLDSVSDNANLKLQTILTDNSGKELVTALNAFAKDAPSSMKAAVYLEIAQAAQDADDFSAAQNAWKDMAATSDHDVKSLALLGEANALVQQKKYDEAVTILESLQKSTPKAMKPIVASQLAIAAEQAGKYDTALTSYEEMKTIANMPLMEFIDFKIEQLKSLIAKNEKPNESSSS